MVSGSGLIANLDATPVPLSETGEPVIATLLVIVKVPFTKPSAVGRNLTLIVQVAPATNVPVQVPPAAPVGRKYRGDENARVMPVTLAVPVL
jgi:hypothetical protein